LFLFVHGEGLEDVDIERGNVWNLARDIEEVGRNAWPC
jgi:hypothetical protein